MSGDKLVWPSINICKRCFITNTDQIIKLLRYCRHRNYWHYIPLIRNYRHFNLRLHATASKRETPHNGMRMHVRKVMIGSIFKQIISKKYV